MRLIFWLATGAIALLAPTAAMAQHHGAGHSRGHNVHGGHGGGHHGVVVGIGGQGYGRAAPYYDSYYAAYPPYPVRYSPRDRYHDRHARPRHHRRHH